MSDDLTKFREITSTQSIDEQGMTFLRAFVGEFQGKFEEVLKIGEAFKKFAPPGGNELDEFQAHRFLESEFFFLFLFFFFFFFSFLFSIIFFFFFPPNFLSQTFLLPPPHILLLPPPLTFPPPPGRGETKTVQDMRGELKEIDLDFNRKVAFIEYLLFQYKKTLKELFSAKPNAAALAKLEKAVAQVIIVVLFIIIVVVVIVIVVFYEDYYYYF